jgi:hypothetical protein
VVPEGYIADKNAYSAMLQLRYQRGAREVSDSLVISPTKQSHDHTSQYHDSIRASLTNCKAAPTPLLERIEQFWSQHPYCPRLDLQEDTLLLTLQLRCNIDPPFQAAILGPETPTPVNAPWLQPSALLLNYLTRRHTDTITPASFDVSTFLAHLHPKLGIFYSRLFFIFLSHNILIKCLIRSRVSRSVSQERLGRSGNDYSQKFRRRIFVRRKAVGTLFSTILGVFFSKF